MDAATAIKTSRELLASVRVPNADYGGTTCSEDELLAVKDSFSDAKRAFIDQQIVAGFSKALRGNTDARAIFKNHGANRALAEAQYESTKVHCKVAKAAVTQQQQAMHDICDQIATVQSSVRRHWSELKRAGEELQDEIDFAADGHEPLPSTVTITLPSRQNADAGAASSSGGDDDGMELDGDNSSSGSTQLTLDGPEAAKVLLVQRQASLTAARLTASSLTERRAALEAAIPAVTNENAALEAELAALEAARAAKQVQGMSAGKQAVLAAKHFETLCAVHAAVAGF